MVLGWVVIWVIVVWIRNVGSENVKGFVYAKVRFFYLKGSLLVFGYRILIFFF